MPVERSSVREQWLVAGGWWLVAGGWWLVAGGWCPGVQMTAF